LAIKDVIRNLLGVALRHPRINRLARRAYASTRTVLPKRDIFPFFDNILGHPTGPDGPTPTDLDITWVIPDFSAGSGGHGTIFRMVGLLQTLGFPRQGVTIVAPHRWANAEQAKEALRADFGIGGVEISLGGDNILPARFVFATGWQTAYWVSKFRGTPHRLYFVQDFEPAFYASGSESFIAEETYRLGLIGVTAGTWLSETLATNYGMRTFPFRFSYDKALYRQIETTKRDGRSIFFYARPVTPRRCFELGLLALRRVCEAVPDARVIFAGWDIGDHHIPFQHVNAGQLQPSQLPALFSEADVAIVLSGTNFSLMPIELAACGCPLVMNDGPYAKWGMPDDCASYVPMEPEAIARATIELLRHPEVAAGYASRAKAFVEQSDWAEEAGTVGGFLRQLEAELTGQRS
jgi:glycosyltransferase involved in cell wall biosynthesis